MKYYIQSENMDPSELSRRIVDETILKIKSEDNELNKWYNNYVISQKNRLAFDLDHLQRYSTKGSQILEVGSIPLILTIAINELGYKIQGIDISPERFQSVISVHKLDIQKQDIEKERFNFESNQFDIVIFNELFEHLRINPIHTMSEVFRVLKPNGILMLSTPNFMSWRNIESLVMYNKGRAEIYNEYSKLQKLGHMGHVRLYTYVEIADFLGIIGFEVKRIIFRGTSNKKKLKKVIENKMFRALPKLRPFFSIIAKK